MLLQAKGFANVPSWSQLPDVMRPSRSVICARAERPPRRRSALAAAITATLEQDLRRLHMSFYLSKNGTNPKTAGSNEPRERLAEDAKPW